MESHDLIEIISKYKSLSIIGMDKNVGKTTVLNYIIEKTRGSKILGLTSIGRDGEDIDLVTNTIKPKIYVEKGTLIATAKQCLFNSDITREIIKTTSMNTPMGEIVIARALSDGYVELGGPITNTLISKVCTEMQKLGGDIIIVDGALSKRTFASPSVTEATILSTGAALDKSMDKVIEKTLHLINLLSVKCIESSEYENIVKLSNNIFETSKVAVISKDGKIDALEVPTAMECGRELSEHIDINSNYVLINGVVTDKLLEDIMRNCKEYENIRFIVKDGTKLFLSQCVYNRFIKHGGKFNAIYPINLSCVTCNPKSPYGYEFDSNKFISKMRRSTELPVFDVVGGN